MRGANVKRTARARQLRSNATNAELWLWNQLRSRAIDGFKFVRQEPIGPYIVDFVCRERHLIIEIDGGQHADNKRDELRDSWLRQHNYQVLRFRNNDVLQNTNGVLEVIAQSLRVERPPHPTAFAALGGRPLPASGER